MRIVVVGATGDVGSVVVRRLRGDACGGLPGAAARSGDPDAPRLAS